MSFWEKMGYIEVPQPMPTHSRAVLAHLRPISFPLSAGDGAGA